MKTESISDDRANAAQIGQAIRQGRQRENVSADALARRAGVSRSTLDHIERFDGRTDVGLLKVAAAAREVGLHLGVLAESPQRIERRMERERSLKREANARERHARLAALLCLGDEKSAARLVSARDVVELWRKNGTCSQRYIDGWSDIVYSKPKDAARKILEIDPAWVNAMFQNSPIQSVKDPESGETR